MTSFYRSCSWCSRHDGSDCPHEFAVTEPPWLEAFRTRAGCCSEYALNKQAFEGEIGNMLGCYEMAWRGYEGNEMFMRLDPFWSAAGLQAGIAFSGIDGQSDSDMIIGAFMRMHDEVHADREDGKWK